MASWMRILWSVKTCIRCPHRMLLNSFNGFYCGQWFNFGHTVMLLGFCQVSTEERYWLITLSNDRTKLFRQGISVYLKFMQIIWVSQYYITYNSSLYIPVPCPILGLLGSGDFCMTTLSYRVGQAFHYILPKDLDSTWPCPGTYGGLWLVLVV